MSFLGAGSLLGAIAASIRSKRGLKTKIMLISSVVVAVMLILIGLNSNYIIASLLLFITGLFNIQFSTTANSTLQLNSKDNYRGRVMSVYSLAFAGATPLGSLFTGFISERLGPSQGFMLSGISIIVLVSIIRYIFWSNSKKIALK